jgi:SPP1 family predicted phage head-tail adaptor
VAASKTGAGTLDRRIQILVRTLTPNAYNEQIESYTTLATVWGAKEELSGSEVVLAQQLSAVKTTQFRIRWRGDVTNTCKIVVEGVTYVITYVAEVGRRRWLELTCTTVAA